MQKLSEYNIWYGIHFPAGHHLSYIKKRHRVKKNDLKETERVSDKLISLPLFPDMIEEDVSYACEAIREILAHE